MSTVLFGHQNGQHLAIEVFGREHPDAGDYWDGNWLSARISMRIGPWHGEYDADLRTTELADFRRQLEEMFRLTRKEATLDPMEPWLKVTLRMNALGHIAIVGEASPEYQGLLFGQVGLRFEVDDLMDQSHLSPIIAALQQIETEYPVVGIPDS
jgi:hypothetical protein